jgi:flagellar basal-body rod protein FlgB
MASHASQRHAVIADNIANADTPNYKAKDLKPFAEIFTDATRTGTPIMGAFEAETLDIGDALSPNGNSVSLEDQMMRSAQVQNDHQLSLMLYKKSLGLMKLAIGKNL